MKRLLAIVGYFTSVSPVHATVWGDCTNAPGAEGVATVQCIVPLFERVVQGLLALSGVALFVMLVVGGYNFLLSGGDQKKLETARGTITGAIIGLIVMVMAFLIIKTIAQFTGAGTVTQFTIPWWIK